MYADYNKTNNKHGNQNSQHKIKKRNREKSTEFVRKVQCLITCDFWSMINSLV